MLRSLSAAVLVLGLVTLASCAGTGGRPWTASMTSNSPMYTAVSPSAAASREVLKAAPICCDSLSALRFAPINLKSAEFHEINASSQAFEFSTGKSLVQGLAIPDELERATVILDAIAGATVFVPTVLVLDRDFQVSRAIDSGNFEYTPAGLMEPQRLRGSFLLDRRQGSKLAGEKYLVVFTTDKDLKGSTQMISEARLHARSRGLADPRLPDPVAEHAATGVFRLRVAELETGVRTTTEYVEQRQQADRYLADGTTTREAPRAAPAPVPVEAKPAAPPRTQPRTVATTPAAQPMLRETQAMYDNMIRDAVASGNMDRAWRLVQEAERAGSTTARQTFLQAVERK